MQNKTNWINTASLLLLLVSVAAVVYSAIYTGKTVNSFSDLFISDVEFRMRAEAQLAATLVTPEELDQLNQPADIEKPLYAEIKKRLTKFGIDYDLKFVYVYRLTADLEKVRPIVDNDYTEDSYTLATEALDMEDAPRRAFAGETITPGIEVYSIGYSGLLSAFAPIRDRNDNVIAIAGVDISDKYVIASRNLMINGERMLRANVLLMIFAGGIFALLTWRRERVLKERHHQEELTYEITRRLAELNYTQSLDEVNQHILTCLGSFFKVSRCYLLRLGGGGESAVGKAESQRRIIGESTRTGSRRLHVGEIDVVANKEFAPTISGNHIPPLIAMNDSASEFADKFRDQAARGVKAFVWKPLYVNENLWGLLVLENCERSRKWTSGQIKLIEMIGGMLAGALERERIEHQREEALQKVISANSAKSSFLANMSHEIRTPLNAVLGMAKIGAAAPMIERKNYCFSKIFEAGEHLLGVIGDILDMSKIEANKLSLSIVDFNFERIIRRIVDITRFRLAEKKQELGIDLARKIPAMLRGDDQRIAQVILNFLSNACKFTPENGKILLSAQVLNLDEEKCEIRVSVKDSGIGLNAEQISRLFRPFEQAESDTTRKYGGTGLGLSISHRLIALMGGTIAVDSQIKQGAEFSFTLVLPVGAVAETSSGIHLENLRVMIIDDDVTMRNDFATVTENLHWQCDFADSAREAMAMVAENPPYDLFFVDHQMPEIDGVELVRLMRQAHPTPFEVVMISGGDPSVFSAEANAAGVKYFLVKPLFASAVVDSVMDALRGSPKFAEMMPETKPQDSEQNAFVGKRVLLAEDVEINREIVQTLLEPTGLEIECAYNGFDAVRMFKERERNFDLIFMDIQMPEMDGYEATRQIRALAKNSTDLAAVIPIVAMTANVFREDVEKCLACGMNAHVEKPIQLEAVVEILHRYLR